MRREVDRRPLLVAAVGLALGLTLRANPENAVFLLLILLACRRWPVRGAGVGAALLGVLLTPPPTAILLAPEPFAGRATVASVPRFVPSGMNLVVEARGRRWRLDLPARPEVNVGDVLEGTGRLRPPADVSLRTFRARGLSGRMRLDSFRRVSAGPWPYRAADGARRSFVDWAGRTMAPGRAEMADALCFNVDSLLTDEQFAALRRAGTVHVVSASGAHVAALAAAVLLLLKVSPLPRHGRLIVLFLLLGFFAMAAGMGAPIVRSCLVVLPLLTAYLVRRTGDFPSAWAFAAIVILLSDPRSVYDPGTQLSFATVGALGLFAEGGPLRSAFVASTASAPLAAWWFGTVSLFAIPANLLVAAAVGIATVGGFGAWLVSFVWPWLGARLAGWLVEPLLGGIEASARWLPEWSLLDVPWFPGWSVGAFLLGLAALYRPRRRPAERE